MAEVIDLSHEDDGSTADITASTQQEDADGSNLSVYLGHFDTEAVGIRYYQGQVNLMEMVVLERDPGNPYDNNAISVNNVMGIKVGHISAKLSAVLAPMIDSHELHVEGLATGPKGKFNMPMAVLCYGPPDPEAQRRVTRTLFEHDIHLFDSDPADLAARSQKTPERSPGGPLRKPRPQGTVSAHEREEALEKMFEALGVASEVQDMLKPAREIASRLYPHQMVALAWMVKRENSNALPPLWEPRKVGPKKIEYMNTLTNFSQAERPPSVRGGCLADDMGLGKTLTTIALIATNRPGRDPAALQPYRGSIVDGRPVHQSGNSSISSAGSAEPPSKKHKGGSSQPSTSGTQGGDAEELARAAEGPPRVPSIDGPKATLIVCPPSVMSNWQTQILDHTSGTLNVYMYHGDKRDASRTFLASQDVVITSYQILVSEMGTKKTGPFAVEWLRVVLDEAQAIKNHKTKISQAVRQLKVERRWALSGTPIQNKLLDLFGITVFLDFKPCNNKKIFTQALERPVKLSNIQAIKNLQVLVGNICLRRTKDMRVRDRPLVALPPKTVSIVEVPLTDEDMKKYTKVEGLGIQILSGMLSSGEGEEGEALLKNYALVLTFLLRLRQISDAGSLVSDNVAEVLGAQAAEALSKKDQNVPKLSPERIKELQNLLVATMETDSECTICFNEFDNPVITACTHAYCRACIERVISGGDSGQGKEAPCPLCRTPLTTSLLVEPPPPPPEEEQSSQQPASGAAGACSTTKPSAKVVALMHVLKNNNEINKRAIEAGSDAPPVKAVVFSQFTSMLDLIGNALNQENIAYLRLDGTVNQRARSVAIDQFNSPSPTSPTVFLISLKAGGVGLNLTAACQAHLLEPYWNTSVEEQAQDRVHRLGQTREVEVLRYIAKGTVEERILLLQKRKQQLNDAAFKREVAKQARKMRLEDVKLLMRL